jgi:hypothetical protein
MQPFSHGKYPTAINATRLKATTQLCNAATGNHESIQIYNKQLVINDISYT